MSLYDTTYGPGTPLGSAFIPGSPTQGTMNANVLTGGFSTVPTMADLYAIPVDTSEGLKLDGLSSGRRQVGMVVTVAETGVRYELKIVGFSTLSAADKLAALGDNGNWVVFASADVNKAYVDAADQALQVQITTEKNRMDTLVTGAPAALDTLKEIADQIAADETGAAAVLATIQQHTQALANVVHRTGDETIAGNKTFTNALQAIVGGNTTYLPVALLLAPSNGTQGANTQMVFGVAPGGNNSAEWRFFFDGGGSPYNRMDFGFSGTAAPVFTYLVNGNSGFGTTTPSEKLTVAGNVKATAFIGDGSRLTNLPAPNLSNYAKLDVVNVFTRQQKFRDTILVDSASDPTLRTQIAPFLMTINDSSAGIQVDPRGLSFFAYNGNIALAQLKVTGTGGDMTMLLDAQHTLVKQDPTAPLGIATKQYVDNAVAAGGSSATDMYQVDAQTREDVVLGTYNSSNELDTIAGIAGQRFSYQYYNYEYMPGDAGTLVWIRNKKTGGAGGGNSVKVEQDLTSNSSTSVPSIAATNYAIQTVSNQVIAAQNAVAYFWHGDPSQMNVQLGSSAIDVQLGSNSYYNKFGNSQQFEVFGTDHYHNEYGSGHIKCTFGNNYQYNKFGETYNNVKGGNNLNYTTLGHNLYAVTLGNNINNCLVGDGCSYVTLGDNCSRVEVYNCRGVEGHPFVIPAGSYGVTYRNNLLVNSTPADSLVIVNLLFNLNHNNSTGFGQEYYLKNPEYGVYRTITTDNVDSFYMVVNGQTYTNPTSVNFTWTTDTTVQMIGNVLDITKPATIYISTKP